MLRHVIFRIMFGKEGGAMMAMLWTQKIILGKNTFDQVPRMLKEQVREILIESGLEELVEEK